MTGVRVRLLGPVEVRNDDQILALGPRQQRLVLAVLALEVNRPVEMARLVDLVWPADPPRTAAHAIQVAISRLRATFAPIGGLDIHTEGTGYVLAADPESIDAYRFRALLAQARATADDESRVAVLDQALGQWYGEPLAGTASPEIQQRLCAGLTEARLSAFEDLFDARLRLCHHDDAVNDLADLVASYPLRERLAGQLMLTLYRCGRTADAIAVFGRIRAQLSDELGLDPGPELSRLHTAILRDDPTLRRKAANSPTTVTGGDAERPSQLPRVAAAFAGRLNEIEQLDALLAAPTAGTLVVVVGAAGIGKTTLAVHWAHLVADKFPDGQLYLNLHGFDADGPPMSATDAVRSFLEALAVPPDRIPASTAAQTGLYRSLLAGRRILIVLDNAATAEQVRALLPGAPGCLVVVTSRNQMTALVAVDGAYPLPLDTLTTAEARELLTRRLGQPRVTAEPRAVRDIIARCGRLPLALAVVAARAALNPQRPLSALADELRDDSTRLNALDGGEPAAQLRAVFSWSYQQLSPETARLFRLLGVSRGPSISAAAAASLAAVAPDVARVGLAELTAVHLLSEPTPARFTLHDLLRAYATDLAHTVDPPQAVSAATRRLLDHYLHTGYAAALRLGQHRDPIDLVSCHPGVTPEPIADEADALAWFAAEHGVLLRAVEHAAAAGLDTHTWQLVWILADYLDRRGHWQEWIAVQHIRLGALQRLDDRLGQAHTHRGIATAYLRTGSHAEAHEHLRRATALYQDVGDKTGQAHAHLSHSELLDREGRPREALDQAEHALLLYLAVDHRVGQARALNNIGWFHAELGDYAQALSTCRQALILHQQLGNRHGEAAVHDSLGYAHHHLGQYQLACASYQRALDLYTQLGDRYNQADTLAKLGDVQHDAGDADAVNAWRRALDTFIQLDHPAADHLRAKLAGTKR